MGTKDLSGLVEEAKQRMRALETRQVGALTTPKGVDDLIAVASEQWEYDRDDPRLWDLVSRQARVPTSVVEDRVRRSAGSHDWRDGTRMTLAEVLKEEVDGSSAWIVEDCISAGTLNTIAGKAKAGKSRLSLEVVSSVLTGRSFLSEFAVLKQPPVVLVCGDDSNINLTLLLQEWAEMKEIDPAAPLTVFLNPPLDITSPIAVRLLREELGAFEEAPLLVLDSLYNFTGSLDDAERGPVKKLLTDLKSLCDDDLAAAIVMIDHSAKVSGDGAEAPIGSQAKGAAARSGINAKKLSDQGTEGSTALIELHRWGNSGGEWRRTYQYDFDTFEWTRVEGAQASLFAEIAEQVVGILEAQEGRSMALTALGNALGLDGRFDKKTHPLHRALLAHSDRLRLHQPLGSRTQWVVELLQGAPSIV